MKKNTNFTGALDNIVVIDHTSALAGPYCAQLLGDLGAEVIKVERPKVGDQARGWGPPFVGKDSAYFFGANRNKRSLTLDLGKEQGREVMSRLLKKADVLLHNVPRASSRKKLGLDQEYCFELNSRLIWAAISGFGNTGPYAEKSGYDVIAQGMSGTMQVTGEEGQGPMRFPTPIADISTGIYTALSVMAALFARERTGKGQAIDNALLDTQVTWLANLASNYLASGDKIKKLGNDHPNVAPYQPFATKDGWIIIGVGSEKLWQQLTSLLKLEHLTKDPRFASNAERLRNKDQLVPILAECFAEKNSGEWIALLEKVRIPAGPIYAPEQILSNEHLLARGMIVELEHPLAGMVKTLANPINLSNTPVTYRRPAPMLGEHNQEILQELGYEGKEITALMENDII